MFISVIVIFSCITHANKAQSGLSTEPISIAINETSYPYHFIDQGGQPAGLMVDLWSLWAEKQGVSVIFTPLNWGETLTQVQLGRIDIHAGLSKTLEREKIFQFSRPFFTNKQHLFVHKSLIHTENIDDVLPYTIGVVANSSYISTLKEQYPNVVIRTYPSRHALYNAALNKQVLIFAGVEKISKNFERYQELVQNFPVFKRLDYGETDYCAAVGKQNNFDTEFIEQGFDKISLLEKSAIERKWLGMEKTTDTLLLSFNREQSPYSELDGNGEPSGFLIELWKLWSQVTGFNIEFIAGDVPVAVDRVRQGHADFHIGLPNIKDPSKANSDKLLNGMQIYEIKYGLFLSKSFKNKLKTPNIKGLRIGVIKNERLVSDLNIKFPQALNLVFDNYTSLIKAIKSKQVNAIAGNTEAILRDVLQGSLQTQYTQILSYKYEEPLYVKVSASRPELIPLINDGFSQIPMEKLIKLEEEWHLGTSSRFFKRKSEIINLSVQEKQWLDKHPKVKMGMATNWEPIEFINDFGEFDGINPDIFDLISQRTNIEFEYVGYNNFDALYNALLKGDIDVIGSVMTTEKRRQEVLFTASYWSMPWIIIHPHELGSQLKLSDFKNKRLALLKGHYLVSEIRRSFPAITIKLVNNHEDGLLAVQKGMVEGYIDNLSSGTDLMKKESLMNLTLSIIDEVDKNGNHLAVHKSLPILASILDKAVATISDMDNQQVYEKWFDINIETGLDKAVVIRVAVQIGVLVILTIVIIMVWNRRLYREIKTRKRLESQMKHMATHDDLTGLANRMLLKDRLNTAINFHLRKELTLAVLFIDLDGFKNINDTFGHDVGDELLIEVAGRLKACVRESDTVVRFGGDEFVLLLTGLNSQSEAGYVADKVLNVIQEPMELTATSASICCSIGIAMYPSDGETSSDLLKVADSLMYKVKAKGKNHYLFNTSSNH